ncbi:MAG: protein-tyrosine phosphatase family protein [Endozoicomonas sp.]
MNLIHKGEVELYAHPISTNPDQAEAIWALAEKAETEKIIALQDFTFVASPYLPADDTNEGQFGNFKVKILAKKPLPEISPKAFSLTVNVTNEETGKEREVNIDQFFMWGDDKGLDKNLADQLVRRVPMNKCQIHCLQGVGRTGTLILMKLMQVAADNQELTRDNLVDFIASNIREGRVQRESPEYVKTEAQFKSLMEFGMGLTKATVDNIEQQLS